MTTYNYGLGAWTYIYIGMIGPVKYFIAWRLIEFRANGFWSSPKEQQNQRMRFFLSVFFLVFENDETHSLETLNGVWHSENVDADMRCDAHSIYVKMEGKKIQNPFVYKNDTKIADRFHA